jgi:DNA-directed RNA polymerase II subunit RPB9
MAAMEAKMLFCERCDNLLYPTTNEDKEMRWQCRACKNLEVHDSEHLVFTLALRKELSGTKMMQELAMFAADPTVPITYKKACSKCGETRVAWFVNPLEQPVEDMSLFFACINCKYVWKGSHTQDARPAQPPQ